MRSIFSKIFYSVLVSSILVLATMLGFAVVGIQTSISNWNRDKTRELEALLTPVLSKVYRLNGGLGERGVEGALTPYMTDSLYVYVYDEDLRLIFAVNRGRKLSSQGGPTLEQTRSSAVVVPIQEGTKTVGWLAAASFDFFTYEANRQFISTVTWAALAGTVTTVLLALVMSTLFSLPFSRQTKELVEGLSQLGRGNRQIGFTRSRTRELDLIGASAARLQQRLVQEENLRRQWMQDISHDLRTPITAIKAQFEAMIDGVLDPDQPRLTKLLAELSRMEDLVNALQELSRYESPETRAVPQFLSIADFVASIRDRFSYLCAQKDLRWQVAGTEGQLWADPTLLQRCVGNVVQNAIQYTSPGGGLGMDVTDTPDGIEIVVWNSGQIPTADLPHIFDRLYRGNSARTGEGSGLGLSIAQAIVKLHHGSIEAENRESRVQVWIRLPRRPEDLLVPRPTEPPHEM